MNEKIQNYFKKTAQLLKKCAEDFVCISSDVWKSRSFEQLKAFFHFFIAFFKQLSIIHIKYITLFLLFPNSRMSRHSCCKMCVMQGMTYFLSYSYIMIKVIPIKIATILIHIPDILYFWLVLASS